MRLLKSFLLTIAGFFVVIFLVSLLMPSDLVTSRGVHIEAGADDVLEQVKDVSNWQNWHPVFSNTEKTLTHNKGEQKAEWIANGRKHTLVIETILPNEVRFTLLRSGELAQTNKIRVDPVSDSNKVYVEWSVHTKLKWYPWEKFSGIFFDQMTGPGYEMALDRLKIYLENR